MRVERVVLFAALAAAGWCCALAVSQAANVDVIELTAKDIETGLASHTFTTVDLVQSYLDRIAQWEPYYNAFTYLNPNALSDAAAIDAQIAANGVTLPLQGVPVVIKDSMNVAGVRTTGGFTGFTAENGGMNLIPDQDAAVVARLRAAGAVILGKTNLPRFARDAARANTSFDGPTFNAVNRELIPGASSSGTATATSASFATMGMAEETGGSIENPAGAQMLVGVKTTFGLVPTSGGIPLNGSTRDVFGPNAKSVTDAAMLLNVIAGADPSDPKTANSTVASGHIPAAGYVAGLSTTSLAGKRFGLYSTAFKNVSLSTDTINLYNADQAVLTSLGATVVPDVFSDPALTKAFNTLAGAIPNSGLAEPYDINQWFKTLGPGMPHSVAEYKTATGIDLFQSGGPLLGTVAPGSALADAVASPDTLPDLTTFFDGRAAMLAAFRQVMTDYNLDGLFFPQMSKELPFLFGSGGYPNTTVSEVNLMGTPLVDLPGGVYPDGTPFSVAFLGDQFTEGSLLSYAYAFEQATHFRSAPVLAVPEPGTLMMLSAGALGLVRRRRNGGGSLSAPS